MNIESLITIILCIDLAVLFVLISQLSLVASRYRLSVGRIAAIKRLEDTPSVSLCIPARNETYALADCLTSAISSDYPKLEIIVLDDCSQDETSQIIRSFAHDGVRFVKGTVPSEGWLGKNNAYQTLQEQAKGEYIVFMSVDTRVEPDAISKLVAYMQLEKLSMVSVLPQRTASFGIGVIFAPLRYFWQVVTPIKFNTPLATSLWAIRSENLIKAGGIEQYREKVDVENCLASDFETGDEYRFLIANEQLGVSYEKTWQSQADTSVRLWYPKLAKNYLAATGLIFGHLLLFVAPVVMLLMTVLNIGNANGYIHAYWLLSPILCLLSGYIYLSYFQKVKKISTIPDYLSVTLSFFTLPLLALQEVVLIIASFVQYRRGKVDWKGRNICYPITKKY
ncbi:MAG: glycosyltransferase [Candidatus Saccharibacteria bacterium]|nr:glycosyltransferase [Candidatus Saccharibacteria bacterium]